MHHVSMLDQACPPQSEGSQSAVPMRPRPEVASVFEMHPARPRRTSSWPRPLTSTAKAEAVTVSRDHLVVATVYAFGGTLDQFSLNLHSTRAAGMRPVPGGAKWH